MAAICRPSLLNAPSTYRNVTGTYRNVAGTYRNAARSAPACWYRDLHAIMQAAFYAPNRRIQSGRHRKRVGLLQSVRIRRRLQAGSLLPALLDPAQANSLFLPVVRAYLRCCPSPVACFPFCWCCVGGGSFLPAVCGLCGSSNREGICAVVLPLEAGRKQAEANRKILLPPFKALRHNGLRPVFRRAGSMEARFRYTYHL